MEIGDKQSRPAALYDHAGGYNMLVLTRRIGDSIVVDDDIRISVVAIGGGKVRLAIDATAEVPSTASRSTSVSGRGGRGSRRRWLLANAGPRGMA
jgi:hypothetical protein